jgi:hypothetical protein
VFQTILSTDLGSTVDLSTEEFCRRCDLCNGPLKVLGGLGNMDHSRCVDCGADHVHEASGELVDCDR